jgi:hypothetical protein
LAAFRREAIRVAWQRTVARSELRHLHLHRVALDKLRRQPELSPFHKTFGFHVDGVDIQGIALPDGWQERVVAVDNANTNGIRGLCLEVSDLAVSTLAAARQKDIDFVRVLLRERLVRAEVLHRRLDAVAALDPQERASLHDRVERLVQSR